MGSPKEEPRSRDHEQPQHEVVITKDMLVGMYEVTQAQYLALMGKNPSWFSQTGEGSNKVKGLDTRLFPVEMVTFSEAIKFCEILGKKVARKVDLPTEAEWEFVCRAGTTTPFHFGRNLNGMQANSSNLPPYGKDEKGPFLGRTTNVGSYSPNAWGIYDMHGNVSEWCLDWHSKEKYTSERSVDPKGPQQPSESHITRGGCWGDSPNLCRSGSRHLNRTEYRNYAVGFRVIIRLE